MRPDIALGVELRRLFHALHLCHFGKDFRQQPGLVQQFEGPARPPLGQHPGQLVPHPLPAHRCCLRGQPTHRGSRFRLQIKAKPRRKPHPAQHPQVIFLEAQLRPPDSAHHAGVQVRQSTHVIDHR